MSGQASTRLAGRAAQFWRFSLGLYQSPEIKPQLLSFQKDYGTNINIVLFCCWIADTYQGTLTRAELLRATALLANWHAKITKRLQRLRNSLPRKAANTCYQGFSEAILQDEIAAEKEEQALLANHIFYPVESLYPPHEKIEKASQSIHHYLDILTVPQQAEREKRVLSFINRVFAGCVDKHDK
ncbi:MAG: hypothetical protein K0R12_250 [Gammaproteobacteria bacterium]|jgi:uncharacterized protein (TIGR02444 family)|nr:hypothetical protein [Gammaproteobacteria bacterium]